MRDYNPVFAIRKTKNHHRFNLAEKIQTLLRKLLHAKEYRTRVIVGILITQDRPPSLHRTARSYYWTVQMDLMFAILKCYFRDFKTTNIYPL